jgi:hypothetical protein
VVKPKKWHVVVAAAVVVIAVGCALVWSWARKLPPGAARLLPEADGYVYVNVGVLAKAGFFRHTQMDDPEYQRFMNESGFQLDRDLDGAAFAIHTGSGPDYPRYSEVFVGRFDVSRLTGVLRKMSTSVNRSGDVEVFNIPHQGRTVRVAVLSASLTAVSNADSDFPIAEIINSYHHRGLFSSGGPELLRSYYRNIPMASLAWLVAKVAPANGGGDIGFDMSIPGTGLVLSWPIRQIAGGSVLVGSVRYTGELQLRVDAIAPSDEQARNIAENLNSFLSLYRSAEQSLNQRGGDPDIRAALQSLRVEQYGRHTVLRADIPDRVLKKLGE